MVCKTLASLLHYLLMFFSMFSFFFHKSLRKSFIQTQPKCWIGQPGIQFFSQQGIMQQTDVQYIFLVSSWELDVRVML